MDKELQKMVVDEFLPVMGFTEKEQYIIHYLLVQDISVANTSRLYKMPAHKIRKLKHRFTKNCKILISEYLKRMAIMETHLKEVKESYEGCKKANIAIMTELKNITS